MHPVAEIAFALVVEDLGAGVPTLENVVAITAESSSGCTWHKQ
jgi:hypothetical protein